jgi:hypothetical protein
MEGRFGTRRPATVGGRRWPVGRSNASKSPNGKEATAAVMRHGCRTGTRPEPRRKLRSRRGFFVGCERRRGDRSADSSIGCASSSIREPGGCETRRTSSGSGLQYRLRTACGANRRSGAKPQGRNKIRSRGAVGRWRRDLRVPSPGVDARGILGGDSGNGRRRGTPGGRSRRLARAFTRGRPRPPANESQERQASLVGHGRWRVTMRGACATARRCPSGERRSEGAAKSMRDARPTLTMRALESNGRKTLKAPSARTGPPLWRRISGDGEGQEGSSEDPRAATPSDRSDGAIRSNLHRPDP